VIARRRGGFIRHKRALRWPDIAGKMQVLVKRISFDIEFGRGIFLQEQSQTMHIPGPDMSLIRAWMNRDAIGSRIEAKRRGVQNAGNANRTRVPQRGHLVDVDTEIGHLLPMSLF
jgi:hypothetical protein